jgi:hypothetical protein
MKLTGMSDGELRRELRRLAKEMLIEGRRAVVRSKEPNVAALVAGRMIEGMLLTVDQLPAERRAWALAVMTEEVLIDRLRATSRVSPGERRN